LFSSSDVLSTFITLIFSAGMAIERMDIQMRKLFTLILALVLIVSTTMYGFAYTNNELKNEVSFEAITIFNENFEMERLEQIEQIEQFYQEELMASRMFSDFRTVWGSTRRVTLSGDAGNQLPGGHRFLNGGGFLHSTAGGPSTSVSVGFSAPFASVSVSTNLGNRSDSVGQFVNAPNRTDFFRLHVSRVYEVTPFRTYGIHAVTGQWIVQSEGVSRVRFSETLSARRV